MAERDPGPPGTVDVVVVGAGIAGLSAAAELARDRRVVVLETHDQPATQATGRSAAQFITDYGGPLVRPFTEASRPWFVGADGFADRDLLTRRGMLVVAPPGDEGALDAHASPRRRPVAPDDAVGLFPALRPERVGAALHDATVADLDVAEAVAAHRRALAARGGAVRCGERFERAERVGGAWRVETGAGTWWAGHLVDAAGAWGDVVAERCGVAAVGLRPLRRTACTFRAGDAARAAGHERWPLLADAREDWYVKPEPGQFLASPADETPSSPADARPDEADVSLALDRVRANTTLDPRSITAAWAGLRTFAPDRGLVLGPDPDEPAFVWCVGQGGFGIQTSPAVARTVAALIGTGEVPPDLAGAGVTPAAVSAARARAGR